MPRPDHQESIVAVEAVRGNDGDEVAGDSNGLGFDVIR